MRPALRSLQLSSLALPLVALSPLALTGCATTPIASPDQTAGVALRGNVHGGQQPIVGAHVYLFAANTSGYGNPSISLLSGAATRTSDALGPYVLTAADGSFSIANDYTCTPNSQVYLYALSGDPGSGANSAAGLLAVLGNCPAAASFAASTPFVRINEVSTVAAACALSGFATDATHVSSSGTPLAQTGIANAFANTTNLVDLATGTALIKTPAGNGIVPQAKINTLANILTSCVNSNGPTAGTCARLFANARSGGTTGSLPTDTATAAINIAHNPSANINALYTMPPPPVPFAPVLISQPNDLTLTITFPNVTGEPAADSDGSLLVLNANLVTRISSLGVPSVPYLVGPAFSGSAKLAIDSTGAFWASGLGLSGTTISRFSASGLPLASVSNSGPLPIAIDSNDNLWCNGSGVIYKYSPSGTTLSGTSGFPTRINGGPQGTIALDPGGNAWIPSYNGLVKLNSAGVNQPLNGGPPIAVVGETIAIDHAGNIWVDEPETGGGLNKADGVTGARLSPATGYPAGNSLYFRDNPAMDGSGNVFLGGRSSQVLEITNSGAGAVGPGNLQANLYYKVTSVVIDGSGDIWAISQDQSFPINSSLTEFIGAATPVVTPLAAGVKNNTLGSRP